MKKLETTLKLEVIQDSDNLAEELSDDDLDEIGRAVCQDFEFDKQSRSMWERRMEDATKLALQVTQDKSYPWPNAANVKFPLLTIAALQFASRAYPALVKAPDLVKWRVQGEDPDGQKAARAGRVSAHMSYQLLDQDEKWEEDQDKAFLALPILGCVFKKSYYDPVEEHNCSKLVLPKQLYVHYFAKSIEDAERKTEQFELPVRSIRERELRGIFKERDYGSEPIPEVSEEAKRQGLSPPFSSVDDSQPRTFLEQHCYLDLDGDGYKEPYVVTVHKGTKKVARIVHRIESVVTEQSIKIEELQKRMRALAESIDPQNPDLNQAEMVEQTLLRMQADIKQLASEKPKILKIKPVEYYTKYSFIPSPDGGFYDLGFGVLLGPLNDSVNTLINQLLDSGSMQVSQMGFIGKGARIKGGRIRFSPFEWKRVDVAGPTLRDSLVPLPVNQPSPVLFNLLSLLIDYSERVGSVTDAMSGQNPGQNTPAYNMQSMLEQGLQVFNGIFKRVYRGFRSELRKLYKLNGIYLDDVEHFSYHDALDNVFRTDYTADPKDLIPAADPNAFSNKEKLVKAQALLEMSNQIPGFDQIKVVQRQLEALDIPNAAEIYPIVQGEDGSLQLKFPPQPDPELEIKKADMQRRTLEGQVRGEVSMMDAEANIMVKEAEIVLKMAQAQKLGEDVELKQFELILKELQEKRKTLVEMAKIEQTNKEANDKPAADR